MANQQTTKARRQREQRQKAFSAILLLRKTKQWPETEEAVQRLLQQYPGDVDALHLCGVLAAEQGRHEDAIKWFRRAIKKDSGK